jgi:hypothetical protein
VPLGRAAQRLLSVTRKCLGLVECLVALQTVVELADTFVEQVAGGGGVAVAVFSPAAVPRLPPSYVARWDVVVSSGPHDAAPAATADTRATYWIGMTYS